MTVSNGIAMKRVLDNKLRLPMMRTVVIAVSLAMVVLFPAACSKKQNGGPNAGGPKPPTPVRVAAATVASVPVQLRTFGTGEAYSTIELKSQVSGVVTDVMFNEGDVVEKDQVLFIIDKRPFEVALKQAEANLSRVQAEHQQSQAMVARDKAQAANAKKELARDTELLSRKTISQEEYDQTKANAEALEAAVKADEAAVQSAAEMIRVNTAAIDDAKLQLDYCTIRSPIKGKTGSLLVHKGDLAKANDTQPLVIINQTQPMYVTFTLPEIHLSKVKKAMESGALKVSASIPEEEGAPVEGQVSFIDNEVQSGTGTIRLKATFANEDMRLWPGQYVSVVLDIDVLADVVVVPSEAIQVGQNGTYAYVVGADMTVAMRELKTSETQDGKTVVTEGLEVGETVVTEGQMRLAPGATVKILDDGEAKGAESG